MKYFFAFLKFISLIIKKRHASPFFKEKNIVFIDNKFNNFFDQIKVFFETDFLDKKDTVVVVKFYWRNFYKINKDLERAGIKSYFYLFYNQIPDINKKNVLYPYNGQVNCRLILNRNAKHIFLTHGESNKKASVNRMVRMYDYIVATGDISCDRYLENRVLTEYDLKQGRVIKVGANNLAHLLSFFDSKSSISCIAYFPTWEGGNEYENYSSLSSPNIAYFLQNICKRIGVQNVVICPHPNIGGRRKEYAWKLLNLIENLSLNGLNVYCETLNPVFLKRRNEVTRKMNIKLGVTDISASEFILIGKKIPNVVLYDTDREIYATKKYFEIRGNSLVPIMNMSYIEDFLDSIVDENDLKKISNHLYNYSFSEPVTSLREIIYE